MSTLPSEASPSTSPPAAPEAAAPFVRALRTLLRPLVRLMVAGGVTYPIVAEMLKGLFVDVAQADFRLDGREPTDSRISLLTGLQRRDVRRLREAGPADDLAMPASVNFGARLVAKWLSDARFLAADGEPRPLERYAASAAEASFEELVAGERKDIRPRVVLDEWLRLGVARLDEGERVVLNTDAFVPREGRDEKIFYLAHNLHDHAAAAADNLMGTGPARLERSVHYDALSAAGIEELDAQARRLGMKLLKSLNESAMALEARDAPAEGERQRFTCGVYFYAAPVGKDGKS